jgi:hypothetical protein
MRKAFFIIEFFILAGSIYSNDNYIIERSSFLLRLSVDEENYWEWTVPQTPYIFNENYIQFYPGETIFIEADVLDDKIIKLSVVKEILDETKTIIVEFTQITKKDNERIHDIMLLKIKNPFNRDMEYKANIWLLKYDKWTGTSTIPVRAGLLSYESWPDIIGSIVLYDFALK